MRIHRAKFRFLATLIAVISVTAASGQAGSVLASANASLHLTPTVNHPAALVTASGAGFGAHQTIAVFFDQSRVAGATTNSGGSFSLRFRVPRSAPPGHHSVRAYQASGGLTASARFLVRTNWWGLRNLPNGSGYNPYENVLSRATVRSARVAWRLPVTSSVTTGVAIVNGVAYFGSGGGVIYAVDATTGSTIWSQAFSSTGIEATPTVANGLLYEAFADGGIAAFDASTGTYVWGYLTGPNNASPTVANGVVYLASADSNIYALDAASGALRWSFPTGGASQTTPAVVNGIVFVGSADHNVYALDAATGTLVWSFTTGGSVWTSAAVTDGIVYMGSLDGNLYALDALTGSVRWFDSFGTGVEASPAVAGGLVYTEGQSGNVTAVDAASGAIVWTSTAGTSIGPVVANGVVYVDTFTIAALDAATGAVLWSGDIGGGEAAGVSPSVANGIVYTGGADGDLKAFTVS